MHYLSFFFLAYTNILNKIVTIFQKAIHSIRTLNCPNSCQSIEVIAEILAHPRCVDITKGEGCGVGDGKGVWGVKFQLTLSETQESSGKETKQTNQRETGKSCWLFVTSLKTCILVSTLTQSS